MKMHGKLFLPILVGLTIFFAIESVSVAAKINTLQKIRTADYTDFTRITLEFSQLVKSSVTTSGNNIVIRLTGVSPGSYKSVESFQSVAYKNIHLKRERSNGLTLTIPVSSNVDLKRLHSDSWTDLLTIDMPLKTPNYSVIPSPTTIDWAKRSGKKVVIIDPGHGGFNTNATGSRYCKTPHLHESQVTLDVAQRLFKRLSEDPRYLPVLTRYGDYLPAKFGVTGSKRKHFQDHALLNRVSLAQQYKGDIFISIHCNANPSSVSPKTPRGFEVLYLGDKSASWVKRNYSWKYKSRLDIMGIDPRNLSQTNAKFTSLPKQNKDLALILTDEVKKAVPKMPMRPRTQVDTTNISVVRHLNMPSILAEMGFLTHPSDHELLRQTSVRNGYATAFHKAIDQYFFSDVSDRDQLLIALSTEPAPVVPQEEEAITTEMGLDAEDTADFNQLRNQLLNENDFTKVLAQSYEEDDTEDKTSSNPNFHTVRRGESLDSIAKKYAVSRDELRLLNKNVIQGRSTIHPGNKLRLPNGDYDANTSENSPASTIAANAEPDIYVVKRNDTLGKIAKLHKVSERDLKLFNNKTNNLIHPGDEIKIPSSAPSMTTHYVKSGEIIGNIAKKYGVSLQELKLINNKRSNMIYPGEELKVPLPGYSQPQFAEAEKPQYQNYKVRRGDSLWKIQQRFKVTVDQIKKANGLRGNGLTPGMNLQIPTP